MLLPIACSFLHRIFHVALFMLIIFTAPMLYGTSNLPPPQTCSVLRGAPTRARSHTLLSYRTSQNSMALLLRIPLPTPHCPLPTFPCACPLPQANCWSDSAALGPTQRQCVAASGRPASKQFRSVPLLASKSPDPSASATPLGTPLPERSTLSVHSQACSTMPNGSSGSGVGGVTAGLEALTAGPRGPVGAAEGQL